jgi:phosphate:Na+ symporter
MFASFDFWKILAGIAIFLLGMFFLEESLKKLGSRSFKLFLKKQTESKLKAVFGGAAVTAILQSSSVVNLMLLAFVGANILPMKNALAVMLGSNFGTTITGWWITFLGFSFNIETFALPIVGVSGILLMFFDKESSWYHFTKLLFGFGFLFLGLDYMKTGIEKLVLQIDLTAFNQYPAIVYVLIGIIVTSLIQSSSATMAIVLSALFVHGISFYTATAIILGSEIGTTLKLIIASISGLAAKKRLASGNLIINVATVLIVFIFLNLINHLIKDVIGIKNDLFALAFFQTFINTLSAILFFPFLKPFGKMLEKLFSSSLNEHSHIRNLKIKETEPAVIALEKEVWHLSLHYLEFAERLFQIPENKELQLFIHKDFLSTNLHEKYNFIKFQHGEIHGFAIQLIQSTAQEKDFTKRIAQLISSNRNTMYAAKSLNDAFTDIEQLRNSSNEFKYNFYLQTKERTELFINKLTGLLLNNNDPNLFEELTKIYQGTSKSYTTILHNLYKEGVTKNISEIEISTLINFNREIYTSFKSIIFALKEYLLSPEKSEYFDELPGFIR